MFEEDEDPLHRYVDQIMAQGHSARELLDLLGNNLSGEAPDVIRARKYLEQIVEE